MTHQEILNYPGICNGHKVDKLWGYEEWYLSLLDPISTISSLSDTIVDFPVSDLWVAKNNKLPLIKKIVTTMPLSVQVHSEKKPEAWYIMDCSSDSYIYLGWSMACGSMTYAERVESLRSGDLRVLNRIQVHPGDYYYIAPGVVHALGPKCTVLEVSYQNNDTYRLYDYDRGSRELHIDEAENIVSLKNGHSFPSSEYGYEFKSINMGGNFVYKIFKPNQRFSRTAIVSSEAYYVQGSAQIGIPGRSVLTISNQMIYLPYNTSMDIISDKPVIGVELYYGTD